MPEYTTTDGYRLRVFAGGYSAWGLEIQSPDGKVLFSNPCFLYGPLWGIEELERMADGLLADLVSGVEEELEMVDVSEEGE